MKRASLPLPLKRVEGYVFPYAFVSKDFRIIGAALRANALGGLGIG